MKRAVILTGKFVQDVEYTYPFYRLQEAGFKVDVAVRGMEIVFGVVGQKIVPTLDIAGLNPKDFDLIILPGGARALEYLRQDAELIKFISDFNALGRPIAAICHGSQLLISAKVVKGKKVSGYYSIKDDIENAGATYVDAPVAVDGNLITSPHYKYLGDWMRETLGALK